MVLVNVTKPEAATVVPEKLDAVIVLLLNASEPASVARVPVVGSVTFVVPVAVRVVPKAPAVTKLPPSVIVFPVLSTPVPPFAAGNTRRGVAPETAEPESRSGAPVLPASQAHWSQCQPARSAPAGRPVAA